MDIDDNDAQDQNLYIVEEGSSKVSPTSPSYSLPKFEFDDSLQGHLRFDNLVDNEAFLVITSQEDNHWIEEYSTAVKSTRKNVWSEATSSESVEMLLKSVGQEEKVLEESNRHSSLTNVMDPKGTLESVVLGDKCNSSVGEDTLGKIGDDVNQEASKITTESLASELQEDSSVSKVELGNTGSSQNVENASDVSKNECNTNPDNTIESKENSIDNSINNDTVAETIVSVNEETENGVGSDAQRVTSAETPAEVILDKDDTAGNTDDGAADSSKNAESNMDVLTDAVVAAELSKVSSSDTTDGVQLPSGTVATSDVVTEDQPRSPILGVSLLSDDSKEKVEVGSNSEETSQKQAPVVEQGIISDGAEKDAHFDAGRSEQTADADSARLLDPKESKTVEDGMEPLNLSANMPDQQQASVDVDGSSGLDTNPSSLDKPQTCSSSDTKSIELSQSAKDDLTKGSVRDNATISSSGTNEAKNFTFEVNASSSQNFNLPMNTVSSVSSHGNQLDPIKLHEDSPVSQPPNVTATKAGAKGASARKPRRKPVGTETTKQTNNLKEKTPRRSRKVEKSVPLLTPPVTAQVSPVSNPRAGDMASMSTSNLPSLNNSTSVFHHSFTDSQQVQLRAQILVYGSVLSGVPPEEPHMIAAFGQSDAERRAWEATWHAYVERVRAHKAQPNNPGPSTPNPGVKVGSAQSKILSGASSPIVNPIIPISSPLWNIPTPGGASQSNAMPKSENFGPYQTPGVQNFLGHNPMWLSSGPFSGQWVASSPAASFNARFSSLPITESVKLTTVKESGVPSIPMIPVGPNVHPTASPVVSSGQTSSDPKSRKRKKVVGSHVATSAALSTPVPIFPHFAPTISYASTHGQPSHVVHVDQNMEKIVKKENTLSKIEESKVLAADAAAHAADAVKHCQNVWSQLESQKSSGLVSDDEAKLASSAVSIAAAASVAKVAAAAAKIASNVAEQARLMADEVLLSNRTETYDQRSTTSIISAAKEAARRRIEAASAASKHAENLDAIVKAAELAAEAVSQAGKIVTLGNPLSLEELVKAGPEGYWKSPQSSQQGRSDKQNVETAIKDKEILDVDQSMPQSTPDTLKDNNIIKEGCLVEVRKDTDKKKNAWFTANVSTLKDGKAFVCYTGLQSDDGSGKLQEWVPLEAEGTESPKIRIAHPITTIQSEGTKKRGRTTLTDYAWCSGDRVDVWVQDCWCEAVIVEANKTDLTSLTVQFPEQGETSVVRSWHVKPTLIWKDGKWSSLKGSHSSEGDTPHGKRHKIGGNPVVEGKESRIIPISSQGISIDIGKMERIEKDTFKTNKSGLQKKQSRVVFGVPQPGKTQKFMDVSTHRVDDKTHSSNNNKPKVNPKIDAKEKQVAEVKSKVTKTRKPPVPSIKSLTQKDKSKPAKPASHDENLSGEPNMMDVDSSNTEDAKETATLKGTKVEDKPTSETEPRRSVRRIQPTSRLLEGLQSQLTVSHPSPRSHKVTSKASS
ncbi:protein SWOLLEN 1-like isoform X1 [Bidens hawaiensis]|uniref:protein SWOLLEN 1-like isoform X1 n=1 Tax=Bidens hawaiensis TaxID=980011 RepID=UPI00404B8F9F